jgi:Na+/H+ antiporter NhaD/arsenite permease-like protein
VDFLWTLHHLWPEWLVVNCILLAVYYVWDRFFAYPKERPSDLQRDETQVRRLRIAGLWPNLACLAGVVVTLALLDPARPVPGTRWHAWLYLREIVELGLVAVSLTLGSPSVRRANQFNYTAILEVAALFLGIFVCMQPPLQILHAEGGRFGLESPAEFFWCTGALSSILDNAPTYAVFFETASVIDVGAAPREAGVPSNLLAAISLGAVFMGSMTYIGNGPNFMVKSIAESAGIRMPSFFGYVRYSACVLIPIFVVVTWMLSR